MKTKAVHFIVLAGGESKRMGTNKIHLTRKGRTLLQNRIETLESLALGRPAHVWISGQTGTLRAISDCIEGKGPLGGIWSVLSEVKKIGVLHESDPIVVLPVDMPLIGTWELLLLVDELATCAAAQFENYEMPFGFRFSDSILKYLERLILTKESPENCSVRNFQQFLNPVVLAHANADKFINLNTPADWERFCNESSLEHR